MTMLKGLGRWPCDRDAANAGGRGDRDDYGDGQGADAQGHQCGRLDPHRQGA